jgi:hypothetical protein
MKSKFNKKEKNLLLEIYLLISKIKAKWQENDKKT